MEELVYEFVEHLKSTKAPATRSQRFIAALNFCVGQLGMEPSSNMITIRVRGAPEGLLETKRLAVKAPPKTVQMPQRLETAVIDGDHELTIILAWFILLLFHSRDVQNVQTSTLEPRRPTGRRGFTK